MSELSVLQQEYERLSGVLRTLNRIVINACQDPHHFQISDSDRSALVTQLEYLKHCAAQPSGRVGSENWLLEALERTSPDTKGKFHTDLDEVVCKLKDRSSRFTARDLEAVGQMAAALDTASALLFKRIQPR